jgi:hypothetical protein
LFCQKVGRPARRVLRRVAGFFMFHGAEAFHRGFGR